MESLKKFWVNYKKQCYVGLGLIIVLGLILWGFFRYRGDSSEKVVDNSNFSSGLEVVADSKDISSDDNDGDGYLIEGNFLDDGVVSDEEKEMMAQNTKYLQSLIDNAKDGQVIRIPKGVYYFLSGGINSAGNENYVIKLRSNVSIVGAGTLEEGEYTLLKPYADEGTIKFGLDMFYWNELVDSSFTNPLYLEDVNFSDFIVDGEDVRGQYYNTSGKGFMINLCRDCDWKNVVVRNTDATGFGMDNMINSTIVDCVAINCGKNADTYSNGASGFGIGTGYSDEESVYIKNCKSIGNTKYGFFFEHQGIFNASYQALKSEGFVVVDSYASGNLYNFGGERANDVVYVNCKSDVDDVSTDGTIVGYTKQDIYFTDQSRRVRAINFDTNYVFEDVTLESDYFYKPVYWALKNNITNGVSSTRFGTREYATRGQAVTLLWRMAERPGDVLSDSQLVIRKRSITNIYTGFDDVSGDAWYASAVKWAVNNNIINGTSDSTFSPDNYVTRGQAIVTLWRYAGEPKVSNSNNFTDVFETDYYYDAVRWAYSKNIVLGVGNSEFKPGDYCTREQFITFLYRYQNSSGVNYPISYLLYGGSVGNNKSSYLSGTDSFTLSNPVKEGYTFSGWTGSNGDNPSKSVTISKNDIGNKTFIANYVANNYEIEYNSNGGKGNMVNTQATYDKFVKLEENEFIKDGYQFKGWSLSRNGEVIYRDQDIVKNLTSDNGKKVILYAVWG